MAAEGRRGIAGARGQGAGQGATTIKTINGKANDSENFELQMSASSPGAVLLRATRRRRRRQQALLIWWHGAVAAVAVLPISLIGALSCTAAVPGPGLGQVD